MVTRAGNRIQRSWRESLKRRRYVLIFFVKEYKERNVPTKVEFCFRSSFSVVGRKHAKSEYKGIGYAMLRSFVAGLFMEDERRMHVNGKT